MTMIMIDYNSYSIIINHNSYCLISYLINPLSIIIAGIICFYQTKHLIIRVTKERIIGYYCYLRTSKVELRQISPSVGFIYANF